MLKRLLFWRKEETINQVLERTENQITTLNKNHTNVRDRWRRYISRLVIYSLLAEIIYAAVYYLFLYQRSLDFPALEDDDYRTISERRAEITFWRLVDVAPLIAIPIFLIITRRVINWWFGRTITNYESKLTKLRQEQDKKLDDLANLNKYYETQALLQKYGKKQIAKSPSGGKTKETQKELDMWKQRCADLMKQNNMLAAQLNAVKAGNANHVQAPPTLEKPQPTPVVDMVVDEKTLVVDSPSKKKNARKRSVSKDVQSPKQQPMSKQTETSRVFMAIPADVSAARRQPRPTRVNEEPMGWFDRMIDFLVGPEYNEIPKQAPTPTTPLEERLSAIMQNAAAKSDDDGAVTKEGEASPKEEETAHVEDESESKEKDDGGKEDADELSLKKGDKKEKTKSK